MLISASAPESILLERGILGLTVLILGYVVIFFFKRLIKERDELAAQRQEMILTLVDLVPLIKRSTEIIEHRTAFDEQNHALMVDMYEVLKDVRRLWDTRR
jgi:hypothetical protein